MLRQYIRTNPEVGVFSGESDQDVLDGADRRRSSVAIPSAKTAQCVGSQTTVRRKPHRLHRFEFSPGGGCVSSSMVRGSVCIRSCAVSMPKPDESRLTAGAPKLPMRLAADFAVFRLMPEAAARESFPAVPSGQRRFLW